MIFKTLLFNILVGFFSSHGPLDLFMEDFQTSQLTKIQQDLLIQSILEEEVEATIKQLPNNKAPRPDGICGVFLKKG